MTEANQWNIRTVGAGPEGRHLPQPALCSFLGPQDRRILIPSTEYPAAFQN